MNDKLKILRREEYHAIRIKQMELHVEGEMCIDFQGGETDGKSNEEDVGVD
jgi:hypothetical protein